MSVEEFRDEASKWIEAAQHPRWKRPYTDLVYQPMLEVLRYLRDNGYRTYIVTGGGQDFVRVYAERVYGIIPEQVVGTAGATKYGYGKDGKPFLTKEPKLLLNNNNAGKPEGIYFMIGRRPNAAFGNSIGDREMLEWTGAGGGARLEMLVLHDDAAREYAYGPARGLPDSRVGTFTPALYRRSAEEGLDRDQHEERLAAHLRVRLGQAHQQAGWSHTSGLNRKTKDLDAQPTETGRQYASRRKSPPVYHRKRTRQVRLPRAIGRNSVYGLLLWRLWHWYSLSGSRFIFRGKRRTSRSLTRLRRRPPRLSGARSAPAATAPRQRCGKIRSTSIAMQHATEKTVLGDFNDARFDYYDVTSRFFRKDGRFFVETDGPDGKLAAFEVKYTFGVDPLQQYLIVFPDGRLQALSIAWDSRPKDKGGQRWFHLYPNEEIRHDDVLHWTKLNQNWNFMCAECHSTGVRKNYDATSDRFATTWAEIEIGCEACHGQGSRHVSWARERQRWWPFGKTEDPDKGLLVRFDERRERVWPIDPKTGSAMHAFTPPALRKEVETCGLCHARRSTLSEDWVPGRWLSDTHRVAPLSRGLYHADGQMLDEVYNYGSFKQSKMFAAGVTCSDCHEPHGAALRLPGDGVCLQCHAPDKFASATHHRHEGVDPPLACADCHMPARTYMVIDRRHDHSFRIPRPDLSARLGTPNACTDCHTDKSADWAAAAVERWHGPDRKGFQTLCRGVSRRMDGPGGRGSAACCGGIG